MANRERGEVSFEADGTTWTMKIGTGAMCEIEEKTGKGIAEVGSLLANPKTASISLMRAVFWGSLTTHHKDITVERCNDLIDELGMVKTGQLIGEVFSLAFPVEKKKAGGAKNPQLGTTG
jgi:hypothetical protein